MHPTLVGDLTHVRATYRSYYGTIVSEWTREGSRFVAEVTVPANTRATLTLPAEDARSVTESSHPAEHADGVTAREGPAGAAIFELGSGTYRFRSILPH